MTGGLMTGGMRLDGGTGVAMMIEDEPSDTAQRNTDWT
jgi:hypothetical protein